MSPRSPPKFASGPAWCVLAHPRSNLKQSNGVAEQCSGQRAHQERCRRNRQKKDECHGASGQGFKTVLFGKAIKHDNVADMLLGIPHPKSSQSASKSGPFLAATMVDGGRGDIEVHEMSE